MNKEYLRNNKKQKKSLKKYRNALIKVVIGSIIAVLGLTIPAHIITSFLGNLVIDAEVSNLIAVLTKTLMMAGGVSATVINTIKAHLVMKEYGNLSDEEEEIVNYLEKENDENKEKSLSLEKELAKEKDKNKKMEKEIDNDKIAVLNNEIREKYVYDKENAKVKRK